MNEAPSDLADTLKRIAVLITCHNRREKTLTCLQALYANVLPEAVTLHVILVDDGSTDGTEAAVSERFPAVEILHGDGNLYWNRGMHRAFARALEIGFDGYLWLNDDTVLYSTALQKLMETWRERKVATGVDALYAGSTQDPQTGQHTYGGVVRHSRWKPFRYSLVQPGETPMECHTLNGNCVLIPYRVVNQLGNLEPRFAHAMGDIDYGLRAGKAGIKVWVTPGYVGTCSNNLAEGSFDDASLPVSIRLRKLMQTKVLPPSSWRVFTQRHAGILWPLYWLQPYAKIIINSLVGK